MKKTFKHYLDEVSKNKSPLVEWNGYLIGKEIFQKFNHEQIAAILGGHEMPPKYIGKTRIPENHIRTYHELIDSNKLLSEIERFPAQNFDYNIAKSMFDKSYELNYRINGFKLYSYVDNIMTTFFLFDAQNKKIAAFASFIHRPDIRMSLWQAKNSETFSPYQGNMLVGKIYKFCKEQLEWSIQSDIEQTPAGENLWKSILPKLGLYPKVIDLDTHIVYSTKPDNEIYGMFQNYCWILESKDYYRNLVEEGSIMFLRNNYYVTKKNYIK